MELLSVPGSENGVKVWFQPNMSFRYKDEDLERDEKGELKQRHVEDGDYYDFIPKAGAEAVTHWVWHGAWKATIGDKQYGQWVILDKFKVGEAKAIWDLTPQERHDTSKMLFWSYLDTYAKLKGI